MKMQKSRLKKIVSEFYKKKILVVGDLILDHYIFGSVDRISPEAPVPVVWAKRENFVCGGAANVGLNLAAVSAKTSLCGVLGNDHFGQSLYQIIAKSGTATNLILKDHNRPTSIKTRIFGQHQQVVRVDWESTEYLSLKLNNQIISNLKQQIKNFDAIIIEDYGKGVINPELISIVVELAKKYNKVVTVDPKEEHIDYYEGVTALTPNLKEAQVAAQMKIKSKDEIPLLGRVILEKLKPQALLVTLGEDGMMLFNQHNQYHILTSALEVFDVSGAGDTVIAIFTLALACKASFLEAASLANLAAGIVVGKVGTGVVTKNELLKKIDDSDLLNITKK